MKFHPYADAFPLLEGEEFDELVRDIDKNGQHHPVVIFDGMILDGRNRWRACQQLGIPHREITFRGDDPAAYVVSENITRRHLTPAQRAIAAEKLATALAGRPVAGTAKAGSPEHATTIDEAAKLMDASRTSVKRVRKVRKQAAPEVVAAMDAGEITPTAAENLATRPPEEQREIMTTASSPREVAAKANTVAKQVAAGVSKGQASPKTVMSRQMDLPDLRVVQDVAADWERDAALIKELNPDRLALFLTQLEKSRTATTRLINLIKTGSAAGSEAKTSALKASGAKGTATTKARAAKAASKAVDAVPGGFKEPPAKAAPRKRAAAKKAPAAPEASA